MKKAQSILEYAVIVSLVAVALSAMALYFRRGIQSVIRVAADEAGNQKEAEEIDPLKGVKTAAEITRQTNATQTNKVSRGGAQISNFSTFSTGSGRSSSVSIQEK